MYYRPKTYIVTGDNRCRYGPFFLGQKGDNINFDTKLSPATQYAVIIEANCCQNLENCNGLKELIY